MALSLFAYNALLAVVARLTDPSYGYNANIAAFNTLAGGSAPTINFTNGTQFFQAYAEIGDYEDGTAFAYPLMQAYVMRSQNVNDEKFREFAGPAEIGIEVYHTWEKAEVDPLLSELTGAVVEASVIYAFNRQDAAGRFLPGCGLLYNGGIRYAKQRLQPYGEGYRLGQVFALTFDLRV